MRQWATNLVFCVMTMILLGYVSPSGKYSKQVKLASSVLFVAAILIPAISYISHESYDDVFLRTSLYVDATRLDVSMESSQNAFNNMILISYKSDLAKSIENDLRARMGIESKVSLEIDENRNGESFGSITSVSIKPASPVSNFEEVKKIINNFYSVDIENIYITEMGEKNND
ncbi:MAG: stage III sporulation protein AF [Eubacteriaceae bacterium]|nr:stage III sporulation protein AF [Eubacteriaceae bacterium]